MELKITAYKNRSLLGQDVVNLAAGESLKIKSAEEVILNEKCPHGYKWQVELSVHVTQTDE